ncbi:MAG: hypothetical protein ACODAD_12495 [Planctomycetota bacterium]
MSFHTPTISPATAELELSLPVIPTQGAPARSETAFIAVEPPNVVEPKRSVVVSWTVRLAQLADQLVTRAFPVPGAGNGRAGRLVDRTLDRLEQCFRLLPTQQRGVLAERARLQIERVLEVRWRRYQHFLHVCTAMQESQGSFSPANSYLYLNPASQWVRLREKSIKAAHDELSSDILFFRLGQQRDIRGARMNLECQVLINELADYQPCTVVQWARCSSLADIQQLMLLVRHLGNMRLVAWSDGSIARDHGPFQGGTARQAG